MYSDHTVPYKRAGVNWRSYRNNIKSMSIQDSDKLAAMERIKVVVSKTIQLTDAEELMVAQANQMTFLHAIEMALRKTIEVQHEAMRIKPKQVVQPVSAPMIPPTQLPKKRRSTEE